MGLEWEWAGGGKVCSETVGAVCIASDIEVDGAADEGRDEQVVVDVGEVVVQQEGVGKPGDLRTGFLFSERVSRGLTGIHVTNQSRRGPCRRQMVTPVSNRWCGVPAL